MGAPEVFLDDGRLAVPHHPDELRHPRPSLRRRLRAHVLQNRYDLPHRRLVVCNKKCEKVLQPQYCFNLTAG